MTEKVVFLTIGEAPRTDLQKTFDRYFADQPYIQQLGLLDGLDMSEAMQLLGADAESSATLTSRFLSGESIVMDHDKVEDALQHTIDALEQAGTEWIVLMCTGNFEHVHTVSAYLIEAEKVTVPYVKEHYPTQKIGVLVPLSEQQAESKEKWGLGEKGCFASASPYAFTKESFEKAIRELERHEAEVIVLDCIGYNEEMTEFVRQLVPNLHVVQSNDVLFQFVVHGLYTGMD